jgi:hypothetical protein
MNIRTLNLAANILAAILIISPYTVSLAATNLKEKPKLTDLVPSAPATPDQSGTPPVGGPTKGQTAVSDDDIDSPTPSC